MVAGWQQQLREGKMSYQNASNDEYFAAVIKFLSIQSSKTTNYKFGFYRDIIVNKYQTDAEQTLTYYQLAHSITWLIFT